MSGRRVGGGRGRAACLTSGIALHGNMNPACVSATVGCIRRRGSSSPFFCDMQDKLDRLVIKDPGEILEPQECLERMARRDILGSQVWGEVQVPHTAGARAKDVSPGTFHRH